MDYSSLKISRRIIDEVKNEFPARDRQINEIVPLLDSDDLNTVPASIFVSGPCATGKTCVVKSIATKLQNKNVAWINCSTCFTPRLVFEGILKQLLGVNAYPKQDGVWMTVKRCENIHDFASQLIEYSKNNFNNPVNSNGITIFFDKAENLRRMGNFILKGLLRLREFTGLKIVCTYISHLSWSEFQAFSETIMPSTIYFPQYSKEEALRVISLDCPKDQELMFFLNFVDMVYVVFIKPCNDINELRHIVRLLFPKYIEPIVLGKVKPTETRRLFSFIQYHIRDALKSLYLREISSSEWQRKSIESMSTVAVNKLNVEVNLSYYSKFLLISTFLASYNPPKFDTQFFTKSNLDANGKRKRGRPCGTRKVKQNNSGSSWRQQLLGPKPFPLERMLAIFYSIIADNIDTTVDIYHQIALLIKLKLVIRMTSMDNLESMKCKCNVGFDFIMQISKSLKFDLTRYLHEFN